MRPSRNGIITSSTTASGSRRVEDGLERLLAVADRLDVVALEPERQHERLAHAAVVLGDEDARATFGRAVLPSGHARTVRGPRKDRGKNGEGLFLRVFHTRAMSRLREGAEPHGS